MAKSKRNDDFIWVSRLIPSSIDRILLITFYRIANYDKTSALNCKPITLIYYQKSRGTANTPIDSTAKFIHQFSRNRFMICKNQHRSFQLSDRICDPVKFHLTDSQIIINWLKHAPKEKIQQPNRTEPNTTNVIQYGIGQLWFKELDIVQQTTTIKKKSLKHSAS